MVSEFQEEPKEESELPTNEVPEIKIDSPHLTRFQTQPLALTTSNFDPTPRKITVPIYNRYNMPNFMKDLDRSTRQETAYEREMRLYKKERRKMKT